jgi:hypothetical protein
MFNNLKTEVNYPADNRVSANQGNKETWENTLCLAFKNIKILVLGASGSRL